MDEPRTHYQISVTAKQAVGLFVGLLLSLGLAFFFGLMAGLSGREHPQSVAARSPEPTAAFPESLPPIETAVPTASQRIARVGANSGSGAPPAGAEPTVPPTIQAFEDGTAEETPQASRAVPTAGAKPGPAAARPAAPAGRVWVQVASLSSRGEAEAISARLGKRGYHTQAVSDPKGRIRVRVGPFRTTEDARRVAERLRKQEKIKSPWIVTEAK